MTRKYYWTMAVVAAFVTGTMLTGSVAFAHNDPCSNPASNGVNNIWHVLCDLQTDIENINVEDADSDPTNEIELEINGGSTTCTDITGDASLCDGDDAGSTIYQVEAFIDCPDASVCQTIATCNTGDVVVGGGVSANSNARVFQSEPNDSDEWIGGVIQILPPTSEVVVTAICVEVSP